MRTMIRGCLIGMSLLLVGCDRKDQVVLKLKEESTQTAEVEVRTAFVEERQMPRYLRVIGELHHRVDSKVAADAAGRVTEVLVERGSEVKKADVLIRLDDRSAHLALREAQAQLSQVRVRLNLAEAEWKRNEPLAKSKAIADADFAKLTTDLESIRADEEMAVVRLDTAKKNLADLEVKAPFDGVVAQRMVSQGEYVSAGREVVQLVSGGNLRLLLQVPETAVGMVQLNQEVKFQVPAFLEEEFTGKIIHVGAVVREATRDLLIEAEVANSEGRLKQGMFAEGRLLLKRETGLVVPEAAIKRNVGGNKVLMIKDGLIEECLVELGETVDGWTEVFRGLAKGAQVVLDAEKGAVDGARIKLTKVQ